MLKKVLFVCIHNSARSQMAEALLRKYAGDRCEAQSAGIEPGQLNPIVIEALKLEGINITGKATQKAGDLAAQQLKFDYVITVCDEASAERCPVFPGAVKRLHWGFTDPSKFQGSIEEKLAQTIAVKEEIRAKILSWLQTNPL